MAENCLRILIVEDQQITRLGLRLFAEKFADLSVLDEAENGNVAVEKALALKPDVVLMDIGLPGIDGIEAAKRIKQRSTDIHILILTSHDSDEEILAALASGADGYCFKDADSEQIVAAIRAVSTGAAWLAPGIAQRILAVIRGEPARGSVKAAGSNTFSLSARELQVLSLIVEGALPAQKLNHDNHYCLI